MAKKKYYAVKKGKETGIFESWDICKEAVSGYSGAEFKGFATLAEAEEYLNADGEQAPKSYVVAYVDGSYEDSIKRYSYGCVIFAPTGEEIRDSASDNNGEYLAFRNIAGEVLGAMHAVTWCRENGYTELEICYDYIGIEKWAKLEWKRNNILTERYAAFMQTAMETMQIRFRKIAAHTGNTYNEEADRLAKAALEQEC